jgi:hypothetical protein
MFLLIRTSLLSPGLSANSDYAARFLFLRLRRDRPKNATQQSIWWVKAGTEIQSNGYRQVSGGQIFLLRCSTLAL